MRKISALLVALLSLFATMASSQNTYEPGQPGMFAVDQFMGLNTLRQDPIEYMDCVGFIREYHDWIIDEGDAINPNNIGQFGSDPFPDQLFKWNPPYQGKTETQFDYFYDQMQTKGLTICADMTRTLHIYGASGSNDALLERQPLDWENIGGTLAPAAGPGANNLPQSYKERTDWIHNFVARYGHSQNVTQCELKQHPDEEPAIGLENITYIESWNEQDKIWVPEGEQEINQDLYTFTPLEYAAMASMDYDANLNDPACLIDFMDCNGMTYHPGVNHADPTMKFVMGGTYCLNTEFLEGVAANLETLRNQSGSESFIFDVINFHHYSFKQIDGTYNFDSCAEDAEGIENGWWISPEEDHLKERLEAIVELRNSTPAFQGRELWLSEFGYDDFVNNGNGPNLPEIGDNDYQETVAQWTIRAFLEIAASGFDRAMVYFLRDSGDDAGIGAWDHHCGLLDADWNPKRSWWYVKSLKNILAGMQYDGQLILDGCTGNEGPSYTCVDGCDCELDFTINETYENVEPCYTCGSDADDACNLCETSHECARIYKFKDNTVADPCSEYESEIWAVWSPTSCDLEYEIDLELACGAYATGIILVEGSESGVHIPLTTYFDTDLEKWFVTVPVSETPIFVYEGLAKTPECVEFQPLETEETCTSITVHWDIPDFQEYDSYTVYYAPEGIANPGCPNYDDLILSQNGLSGTSTSASVTGLQPGGAYYVYVIPQNHYGIPYDPNIDKPIWCHTELIDLEGDSFCSIPVTIYCTADLNVADPGIELFDEQNIDICGGAIPETPWWDFALPQGQLPHVCIELDGKYHINYFQIYDAENADKIFFEWAIEADGPWLPLTEYFSDKLDEWYFLSDFTQPVDGIQYLRIRANSSDALGGQINEIFICGEKIEDTDELPPVVNTDILNVFCNGGIFSWEYYIDNVDFEVWASTEQNPEPNMTDINLTNDVEVEEDFPYHRIIVNTLECDNSYRLFFRAIDPITGITSPWEFYDFPTLPCVLCMGNLNCTMLELTPAMFWDYNLEKNQLLQPATYSGGAGNLADEQADFDNPFLYAEGYAMTSWELSQSYQTQYAVVDLGKEYNLKDVSIFAGRGQGAIHIAPGRPGSFEDFRLHSSRQANDFPEWVTWKEVGMRTQYLLLKLEGERPNFGELKICASERGNGTNEIDISNIGVGCNRLAFEVNPDVLKTDYQKLQIWYSDKGAFAEGQHPQLSRPGALSTIVDLDKKEIDELSNPNFQIADLKEGMAYYFAYKLYTNTGQSSNFSYLSDAVKTTRCPSKFYSDFGATFNEECDITGIWWSFEYGKSNGLFEIIESSKFTENPEKDAVKVTKIANDKNDLFYYEIDSKNIADGSTKWLYLRLLDENGATLEWVVWDLSVSPCTPDIEDRNSSYFGDFMEREDYNVNGASVYPNPTKNELFLKADKGHFQEFQILDVVGVSWMTGVISSESEEMKLDISILPPGIYMMQLKGKDTRWQTIKFVVSE